MRDASRNECATSNAACCSSRIKASYMRNANWYFDFISPFSYLQLCRFHELPGDLNVSIKPVLFSALLKHWGHKGPAEIPSKRRFVYRFFKWQASRRSVPFTMPPTHPFNPLPPLRLALAAGATREAVLRIFHFVYAEGRNVDDETSIGELGATLGIQDAARRIEDPEIKDLLRRNTQAAIDEGVFGLPTFVADGELFWGDDSTQMFLDFLRDPVLFDEPDMQRVSNMPMGLIRSGA